MTKKQEYQIGAFANMLGVSIQTLRNWDESGKLKPSRISKGGTRFYNHSKLEEYGRQHGLADEVKLSAILYLTAHHSDELPQLNERVLQAKALIKKMAINYELTVVTDVFDLSGSEGFSSVIKQIGQRKINTLFVDQALLSGNNLMHTLFTTYTSNHSVTLNTLELSPNDEWQTTHSHSLDVLQSFDHFLEKYHKQLDEKATQQMIKKLIEK